MLPVERIEWIDANSPDNMRWFTKEEAEKFFEGDPFEMVTVGQVYAEDNVYVMVVLTQEPNSGIVDGLVKIPKVAILSRCELKCVKSKKKAKAKRKPSEKKKK